MGLPWAKAIDVSTWQDSSTTPARIDWSKPKQHGVCLVINRAVFSATLDEDFSHNWQEQKRLGYLRSAYGFWDYRPGNPGVEAQARALVNALKNDPGEFPDVWIDVERPLSTWPALPPRTEVLAALESYTNIIEAGLPGKRAGYYLNLNLIQYLCSKNGVRVDLPDFMRERNVFIAGWPKVDTGETLEEYIERVGWRPNLYGQWDKWTLWQYGTPARGKEMGMESAEVDADFYNGTEADLINYCGGTVTPPPPTGETNMWTNNAIGLYTKTAGWTNPDFDFIVGYAGGDWSQRSVNNWVLEPNPNLKPIEEQAHREGKPFIALWDFDVSAYSLNQIDANDARWPNEASDYPLQSLIGALKSRNVDGLIIRVMTNKNRLGKGELQSYVSFAARKFVERANKWLYQNKGLNKWTFVLTNDDFLNMGGAQDYFHTWTKNWYLGIEQKAVMPLDKGAWPQAGDKIKAIPPSLGWKIWYHHDTSTLDMMMFNGTKADMYSFLKFGVVTPPPPPPPPPTTDPALAARVTALEADNASLKAQVAQLVKRFDEHTHGKPQ